HQRRPRGSICEAVSGRSGLAGVAVADDDLGADAHDARPRDHGVPMYLRRARAAAALRSDAEALEEPQLARRETGHSQAAVDELAADVVDAAERSPGLGHDLAVEKLGEPH